MLRQVFHFLQECPVCGRQLQIESEYEGRRVRCGHCRGTLVASNPNFDHNGSDWHGSLLRHSDRLPARAALPGAPKVLLAECRDEVFARVATDLAQAGLLVIRAVSTQEAIELHASHRPVLVIVNRDLPIQGGWPLVGHLLRTEVAICAWVYQPSRSAADVTMARLLGVDALVDYGGNLLVLSDAILDCLAGCVASSKQSFVGPSVTGVHAA